MSQDCGLMVNQQRAGGFKSHTICLQMSGLEYVPTSQLNGVLPACVFSESSLVTTRRYAQCCQLCHTSLPQQLLKPLVEKLTTLDTPKIRPKFTRRVFYQWIGKHHNIAASSILTHAAKTNKGAEPIQAATLFGALMPLKQLQKLLTRAQVLTCTRQVPTHSPEPYRCRNIAHV